jgi:hypothetical protein
LKDWISSLLGGTSPKPAKFLDGEQFDRNTTRLTAKGSPSHLSLFASQGDQATTMTFLSESGELTSGFCVGEDGQVNVLAEVKRTNEVQEVYLKMRYEYQD